MDVSPIARLDSPQPEIRKGAAEELFAQGRELLAPVLAAWSLDAELSDMLQLQNPAITVGVAVSPGLFEGIWTANGEPPLADVPPDQDAREFELHGGEAVRLDILTTNDPAGGGAIARFLKKFGEGIQQVEIETKNCDRATECVRSAFQVESLYPATRAGANGTRVNFFLVSRPDGRKILVEFVQNATL